MILENKRSILQKYSGSQKLSQIGKSRLLKEDSNFRNKFVIVFYSCVRVVSPDEFVDIPQRALESSALSLIYLPVL